MIILRKINIASVALVSLALISCNQSSNQTPTTALQPKNPSVKSNFYSGRWDGGAYTSLEILSESPLTVRYCFKKECSNQEPTGTLDDMAWSFPARGRFRGANITMKKNGGAYNGRYKIVGASRVFLATLSQ